MFTFEFKLLSSEASSIPDIIGILISQSITSTSCRLMKSKLLCHSQHCRQHENRQHPMGNTCTNHSEFHNHRLQLAACTCLFTFHSFSSTSKCNRFHFKGISCADRDVWSLFRTKVVHKLYRSFQNIVKPQRPQFYL